MSIAVLLLGARLAAAPLVYAEPREIGVRRGTFSLDERTIIGVPKRAAKKDLVLGRLCRSSMSERNHRLEKAVKEIRVRNSAAFVNTRGRAIPGNWIIMAAVSIIKKRSKFAAGFPIISNCFSRGCSLCPNRYGETRAALSFFAGNLQSVEGPGQSDHRHGR